MPTGCPVGFSPSRVSILASAASSFAGAVHDAKRQVQVSLKFTIWEGRLEAYTNTLVKRSLIITEKWSNSSPEYNSLVLQSKITKGGYIWLLRTCLEIWKRYRNTCIRTETHSGGWGGMTERTKYPVWTKCCAIAMTINVWSTGNVQKPKADAEKSDLTHLQYGTPLWKHP